MLDGFLHVRAAIRVGQDRRRDSKRGIRLDGELIAREVRRAKVECLCHVRQCLIDGLPRQAVHEVDVEVVEMMGSQLSCLACLCRIVNPVQCTEMMWCKALDTERQPVDARLAEGGELGRFDRAGVGLQRDFRVMHERQAGTDGGEQGIEPCVGQQAGRTATEKDAHHPASPDERERLLQVGDQCGDVIGLRQGAAQGV